MEPLSRPIPPSTPGDRVRNWIMWFGVGRLVAMSLATMLVCAGAFWLVRSPTPPTEASLPRAGSSASLPSATPTALVPIDVDPIPAGAEASAFAGPLVVHVAGAVVEPGVYELLPGARIRDALIAAGGPTGDADSDALNLAAPLGDGTRVYVPSAGETVQPPLVSGGQAESPAAEAAGPVDVNRAGATELDALPGVGPATAAAIVTERERNGPFVSVDDLERVPGIGPAKLAALRDLVVT